MSGSVVFLHLAGAVALLLWATRMVRTGVERAYGSRLRDAFRKTLSHAPAATGFGVVLAVLTQSATAVSLIVAGFVGSASMSGAVGIATVLGADLGSALVAGLLRIDLSLIAPLLLIAGTTTFRSSEARAWRQAARIMIGLGLLLLSLQLIGQASLPLRDSPILPGLIRYLDHDWLTAFLVAAVLTWMFHSSLAAILLFATLFDQGVIPATLIGALVLGVNFGGALIAAVLTRSLSVEARVVPLGNMAMRGTAALIALTLLMVGSPWLAGLPAMLSASPGNAAVLTHIGFNAIVALLGMPLAGLIARLILALLASGAAPGEPGPIPRRSALDDKDLGSPKLALANVSRELLGMCERIDAMLAGIFEVLRSTNAEQASALIKLDDEIDSTHHQVKMYLARIDVSRLDGRDSRKVADLMHATIKLEQVADIITRNLAGKIEKKRARQIDFSEEGWRELGELHSEVSKNARLAFNVLLSSDVETARHLLSQKEAVRKLEQTSEARHLSRLRAGNSASLASSSLHIDVIRDLEEINSLLVSTAYPVLEEAGLLHGSRLRADAIAPALTS